MDLKISLNIQKNSGCLKFLNFCSTVNCGNVENEAPREKSIGQKGRSQ